MKSGVKKRRAAGDDTGQFPPFRSHSTEAIILRSFNQLASVNPKDKPAARALPNFDNVSKLASGAAIPDRSRSIGQINNFYLK
jgi:hypothetical protein